MALKVLRSYRDFWPDRDQTFQGRFLCKKKKEEKRKQNKVEAKLQAKQKQEGKQKLVENAEMKSPEEKIGCLLKFWGILDDQTYGEDLHILFSNHGEIKWVDFVRGAKGGIILFKEKAKETLDEVKDADNDQQESPNRWKSKSGRFKANRKGKKAAQAGSAKGKVQFQGKKVKFDSDDGRDGTAGPGERAREETTKNPHQNSGKQAMVLETRV
ncbi:hypothetical protein HPG69_010069 [Diceros bicornis minor]|uniref:XRRM domain-containing protein n=1 Tax=Diceros bicornis minor TaxID=77932 RepID=A0A7J7ER43_DICBM|nr:hypothetical protein HPG69_010069 [Diceros bicornis minor]